MSDILFSQPESNTPTHHTGERSTSETSDLSQEDDDFPTLLTGQDQGGAPAKHLLIWSNWQSVLMVIDGVFLAMGIVWPVAVAEAGAIVWHRDGDTPKIDASAATLHHRGIYFKPATFIHKIYTTQTEGLGMYSVNSSQWNTIQTTRKSSVQLSFGSRPWAMFRSRWFRYA